MFIGLATVLVYVFVRIKIKLFNKKEVLPTISATVVTNDGQTDRDKRFIYVGQVWRENALDMILLASLEVMVICRNNGTACVRHQYRKTALLNCQRYLISFGVENKNNI